MQARSGSATSSGPVQDPTTGIWALTGSLNTGRDGHTATLLPNRLVLVAGGGNSGFLSSAELYHPATRTWSPTGSLNTGRTVHTATLLANGMVLVAGGANDDGALASAELYDPGIASNNAVGRGAIDNQGDEGTFHVSQSK